MFHKKCCIISTNVSLNLIFERVLVPFDGMFDIVLSGTVYVLLVRWRYAIQRIHVTLHACEKLNLVKRVFRRHSLRNTTPTETGTVYELVKKITKVMFQKY